MRKFARGSSGDTNSGDTKLNWLLVVPSLIREDVTCLAY